MKALIGFTVLFVVALAVCSSCLAEGFNVELKQGALVCFDSESSDNNSNKIRNVSTFTIARTEKVEAWGKWNALWEGWTLDGGLAYDSDELDTVAILVGRKLGVIGDYIPIDFPLDDLLSITVYPIGVYAEGIQDNATFGACVGGAIIEAKITF